MKLLSASIFLFLCSSSLIFVPFASADNNTLLPVITVINPIRGNQLGLEKADLLTSLQSQWQSNKDAQIHATWLWQYTALENEKLTTFAKLNMNNTQEFGIFFEIDRNFTQKAHVLYRGKGPWYFSDGLLLDSYDQSERRKLIDTAFVKFKQTFGYYPKTVGAWWMGADSLTYMQQKYGIIAALKASEQFDLDVYSIWGAPWSIPYIPSAQNAGMPANSWNDSSHIVMMQWAARDPTQGYGASFGAATYSIQDYPLKGYDFSYFDYLSKVYLQKPNDQIVIGLENGNQPSNYQAYYRDLLLHVHELEKNKKVNIVPAKDYAQSFLNKQTVYSPTHYFLTKDFKTNDQSFWYNGTNYRVGIQKKGDNILLVDLRDYSRKTPEDFSVLPNSQGYLRINEPAIIDSVRMPQEKRLLTIGKEPLQVIEANGNITLFSRNKNIAYITPDTLKLYSSNNNISKTFSFNTRKPYINVFIIMLSLNLAYFVILYFLQKNIKITLLHELFLLIPLVIAYPLLSSGEIDRLNFFFDKKEFILFPLLAIPIFPLSLRVVLVFQIIPFILLLLFHYLFMVRLPGKFNILYICMLSCITILYFHLPYFPLDKSTYVFVFGVLCLLVIIAISIVLSFFWVTKSKKLLYISIAGFPVFLAVMIIVVVVSRSTYVITPFEMEALQLIANNYKDVVYLTPTNQPVYKAVRPLLLDNYQAAAKLTNTHWNDVSKIYLLVVPRYLGSNISEDEVKQYKMVKVFDNAQIAIYDSSRSISYKATINKDSLHPSGVFSLYSGE